MARPDFDLNLMRIFLSVVRDGSTVAAAKRLGVTQSAVSHSLRRLREHFGDQLFTRGSGGLRPTPRALELIDIVEPIMRRIDEDLLSERAFDPSTSESEVRIAITDVGEIWIMPLIFETLRREAPNVSIRTMSTHSTEAYQRLADNEVDIVITGSDHVGPDLHRQWLFTDRFVLFCHKEAIAGLPLDLDAYLAREHVAVALPGKQLTIVDEELARQGHKRKVRFVTEHYLLLPHLLVEHPDLIAAAPSALLQAASLIKDLGCAPLPFPMSDVEIFQLWHGANNRSDFHRWLRALIKRCAKQRMTVMEQMRLG